ncbi:MAG: hypothetical protein M3041_05530 [Acidobacteriota bacterium]|nr:hypothetical protein [Acidobacteriota bacterium]
MRIWPLAVGVAVFALPAAGAWFEVSPQSPTSETPVTIMFITEPLGECGPSTGEVTVSGHAIHVRLYYAPNAPVCLPNVAPRSATLTLGKLPIGDYALTADYKQIHWEGRFVVRSASTLPLAVASKYGGLPVNLVIGGPGVSATFGDVPAPIHIDGGRYVATAPPHDPGLYTIKISAPNQNVEIPGGVYYFDPDAPPDPSVFEPILFPVLDSPSGAFGSRWMSNATIHNDGAAIETFNRIDHLACIDRPCMELRPTRSTLDFSGIGFPRGVVLYVPRQNSLAFGLRIVNASVADDVGFELQPVRESQFFDRSFTLLNVPVGQTYRTKLRIYALGPVLAPYVSIGGILSNDPLRSWGKLLPLRQGANASEPAYVEVDLQTIPELQGLESATIGVGSPARRMWAFAAAVQNKTQRTLIVTPQ